VLLWQNVPNTSDVASKSNPIGQDFQIRLKSNPMGDVLYQNLLIKSVKTSEVVSKYNLIGPKIYAKFGLNRFMVAKNRSVLVGCQTRKRIINPGFDLPSNVLKLRANVGSN
jgi:hypothetical protein